MVDAVDSLDSITRRWHDTFVDGGCHNDYFAQRLRNEISQIVKSCKPGGDDYESFVGPYVPQGAQQQLIRHMRELEAAAKTSAPFLGKIYKVPPGHPDPKTPAPAAENIQVYTPPPGSEPYVSKFFPLPAPRRLEGLYPLDPLCCTHHKHDATSSLEVAHEGQMSASALAGFL